ncbi:MAG: helix-turn-helix domain-containing protein [Oscillospiraceae bacterium]|nr:helix-turn-helix domain-containing protein [Oscillospiraceae bacterium]
MTMGERIKQLRKKSSLTQEGLGKLLMPPVNRAAVNKWEKGRVENIKRSHIQQMAELFNVSPSYLMGYDDMDKVFDTRPVPPQGMLPIIGLASAGKGVIAEEDIIGYESADTHYANNPEYEYIQVVGDSMSPKIDDGDLVLVHKQPSVDSGSIGVFIVDGEDGYVKKVKYDTEYIHLISYNPYYPPMVFEGPDVLRVRVVGKVISMVRKF